MTPTYRFAPGTSNILVKLRLVVVESKCQTWMLKCAGCRNINDPRGIWIYALLMPGVTYIVRPFFIVGL